MLPRLLEGNLVLVLDDEIVLRAKRVEVTDAGVLIDSGKYQVPASRLTHAWQLDPGAQISASVLAEKSRIGAGMLDLELAARAYEKDTASEPWRHANSPVIFGAASLTLTLLENRTSEGVDMAFSPDRSPIMEPDQRFRQAAEAHLAMRRNTEWFLSEFLPGTTYEDMVIQSEERYLQSLGSLASPAPVSMPESVAEILRARSIEL